LDLVGFDRDRSRTGPIAILAGEAKASPADLFRLIADMKRCRGRQPDEHAGSLKRKKTEHNKCIGLMGFLHDRGRIYFWGVAPGTRRGMYVTGTSEEFSIEESDLVPYRAEVMAKLA
jgi:hypothetical protein